MKRTYTATPLAMELASMNWHTDWERAEAITAWGTPFSFHRRKTFAIRSAALALLAFTVQWAIVDLALRAM